MSLVAWPDTPAEQAPVLQPRGRFQCRHPADCHFQGSLSGLISVYTILLSSYWSRQVSLGPEQILWGHNSLSTQFVTFFIAHWSLLPLIHLSVYSAGFPVHTFGAQRAGTVPWVRKQGLWRWFFQISQIQTHMVRLHIHNIIEPISARTQVWNTVKDVVRMASHWGAVRPRPTREAKSSVLSPELLHVVLKFLHYLSWIIGWF